MDIMSYQIQNFNLTKPEQNILKIYHNEFSKTSSYNKNYLNIKNHNTLVRVKPIFQMPSRQTCLSVFLYLKQQQSLTDFGYYVKSHRKKKKPEKYHWTINPPVKKAPRTKAPRNNVPPVTNCPLLQIDGVCVLAATTYTHTRKHSMALTRQTEPNLRATRGF